MKRLAILSSVLVISGGVAQAEPDVKVWTRLAGSSTYDFGYAVAVDASGNVVVAGATQGSMAGGNAGRYDLFVAKYNSAGNRLWLRQRGSSEQDFAYGVATDASGNIYVTGYTGAGLDGNSAFGEWDVFLTKFDASGNWHWTRQDGTGPDDEGRAVATDSAGNIYITGYVRGNFHGITRVGSADVFISKYNAAGTRLWSALFGSEDVDESFGIACDTLGGVYVTGWCSGSIDGDAYRGNGDNFLVKYNAAGQKQWLKQWGTANKDTGYSLACDAAANVYVSGYTTGPLYDPPLGNRDYFLAKYDAAGNSIWGRQAGTSGHEQGWGVATDADGNVYVAGEAGGPLDENVYEGGLDVFLTKYDPAGTRLWTQQIGTAGNDWADGVAVASDGSVYLAGATTGNLDGNVNQGLDDAFVMKFAAAAGPPAPPTNAQANPAVIGCGGISQLTATPGSGGDTVLWFASGCGGAVIPGGASPTVNPARTTTYYAATRDSATGTTSEACVFVTVVVNGAAGDLDGDCDVDLNDFAGFQYCFDGPNRPLRDPGCDVADFDGDYDVDLGDFGIFQACYNGPNRPPRCE